MAVWTFGGDNRTEAAGVRGDGWEVIVEDCGGIVGDGCECLTKPPFRAKNLGLMAICCKVGRSKGQP